MLVNFGSIVISIFRWSFVLLSFIIGQKQHEIVIIDVAVLAS